MKEKYPFWKSRLFMANAHLLFGLAMMTPLGTNIMKILMQGFSEIVSLLSSVSSIFMFSLSLLLAYTGWEVLIRGSFLEIHRLESTEGGIVNVTD